MNRFCSLSIALLLVLIPIRPCAQTGFLTASLGNVTDSGKLWTLLHIGDSLVNAGQVVPSQKAYEQAITLAQAGDNLEAIEWLKRNLVPLADAYRSFVVPY